VRRAVADTSVISYHDIHETLGEQQRFVLDLIAEHPYRTDRELARLAGVADPNVIRPRRCEITKRGRICEAGHRRCRVTGRLAATWRVVTRQEQLDLFPTIPTEGA
jgi:hypothetical protein